MEYTKTSVPQTKKDIPVFSRKVIEAMSVSGKGIAKLLSDEGWIRITDEPVGDTP